MIIIIIVRVILRRDFSIIVIQPIFEYRIRIGLIVMGSLVTGAHQMRRTAAARGATAAIAASLGAAARALIIFPIRVRVTPGRPCRGRAPVRRKQGACSKTEIQSVE